MFSDTHFHFNKLNEDPNFPPQRVLEKMAQSGVKFALDIGVLADDLPGRVELFKTELAKIDAPTRAQIEEFVYFAAGIWPDADSIRERKEKLEVLQKNFEGASAQNWGNGLLAKKIVALGECGLDHHWNPAGVDNRDQNDFSKELLIGERELFEAQLEMAKKMGLPVIVHSRDAAEETLDCIKNVGYHNGIIHCYSYGLEEARQFLDLGWHISFSGAVTYTKKSKAEAMRELLRFVPNDRILVETDAPFLSPVPHRGTPNNPTYIEHTYNYIAAARETTVEELCSQVEENACKLFGIE